MALSGCTQNESGRAAFEPAARGETTREESGKSVVPASFQAPPKHPTSAHISEPSVASTNAASRKAAWSASPPAVHPPGPRVYARTRFAWIRSRPSADSEWLGYLWLGGSVPIRKDEPRGGPGCSVLWQPVEPRGYMCPNGITATMDPNDPVVTSVAPYRPQLESAWPHRYGEVHENSERYEVVPDVRTQETRERYRSFHLDQVARAARGEPIDKALLGVDLSPAEKTSLPLPSFPFGVTEGRTQMKHRSALAYTDEVRAPDRSFLLAADMSWVPKDYVRPYPKSAFEGVSLDGSKEVRVAFFRRAGSLAYRLSALKVTPTTTTFARLAHVALTGARREVAGTVYLETTEGGLWLRERDAVLPVPSERTPWGALVGAEDTTSRTPRGRATWIEVSIMGGWLIAYEGTHPRYATMISAGHGGTAEEGRDPLENSATPTGSFSINGKFATATMASGNGLVHGDVPWTQNFVGPYAVHTAYWHDDFGNLQSGGCVNVSPLDGRWLFAFTEPTLPEGWHGVRSTADAGPSTTIVLHD